MNTGDSVYCIEDLRYNYKGKSQTVKSGYSLIIKQEMGDNFVCERFGKMFVVKRDKLRVK